MSKRFKEIIFFGRMNWNFSQHLWHHLLREFAIEYSAYYIDPLYSTNERKNISVQTDNNVPGKSVCVVTFGRLPGKDIVRKLFLKWRVALVSRFFRAQKLQKPLLLFFNPWDAFEYRNLMRGMFVVYYATDNGRELCGAGIRKEYERREHWLCNRADVVFGLSKVQSAQLAITFPQKAHYISEGVNPVAFRGSTKDPSYKPTACYIGTLDQSLDWELFEAVARTLTHIHFILLGPIMSGELKEKLSVYKNITFTGYLTHTEMRSYLQQADIGLLFYKDNEFNRMRNPIKLLEYFAAGKLVVSTNTPAVHDYPGLVWVAENWCEYAKMVEEAIVKNVSRDKQKELLAVAAANTWSHRKKEIENIIEVA